MKIFSHPDKELIDHLQEVANKSIKIIDRIKIQIDGLPQHVIREIVYIIGATHDLGKATSFFQNYIQNLNERHRRDLTSHSLFSAIFTYWLVKQRLKKIKINDLKLKTFIPVLAFLSVKRHHGLMENFGDELIINENKSVLIHQYNAIELEVIKKILSKLFSYEIDWGSFGEYLQKGEYIEEFENFSFEIYDEYQNYNEQEKLVLYSILVLFYSILLFADKQDVIINNDSEIRIIDIFSKIREFRRKKGFDRPKKYIDKEKNKIYIESLKYTEKVFSIKQHLYSISLPTGMGKTILSLALAEKIKKIAKLSGRIIINIPFTSIIDQNFKIFEEILTVKNSDILLKHHHLSEPLYKKDENNLDYNKSEFLIEAWQSNIVVSTFVQLLETLFTVNKNKLLKFPSIINSVIVLDEVQNIPLNLWETVRKIFNIFAKLFNIYFIFVTATQPLIFEPKKEIIELVPNYQQYFLLFNRTQLVIRGNIDFEEFKVQLFEYINKHPKKDILIVLNTKKITFETFNYLARNLSEDIELYYLTTYITPYERKSIIKKIKQKTNRQKVIVSTQLIEAGVDISVDTVFRQMAPLDSIIQSAGRANRYNEKTEISEVFIYDITDFQRETFLIYGKELLFITKRILTDKIYTEKNYLTLIKNYYEEIKQKIIRGTTSMQINNILELNFKNVNKFNLIQNNIKTESVFVAINKEARNIWKNYIDIYNKNYNSIFEKKQAFSKIKTEFFDFVINVNIPWGQNQIDIDAEKLYYFYFLDPEISSFYSYNPHKSRECIGYHNPKTLIF